MKDGFASYEDRIEAWAPNMSLGRLQRDGGETAEAPRGPSPAAWKAALRLPPPLRAAYAVHATRAVQDALREEPVRRRDRAGRRDPRCLLRGAEGPRALRRRAHRRLLRPRRGPRRARRRRARAVSLPRVSPHPAPPEAAGKGQGRRVRRSAGRSHGPLRHRARGHGHERSRADRVARSPRREGHGVRPRPPHLRRDVLPPPALRVGGARFAHGLAHHIEVPARSTTCRRPRRAAGPHPLPRVPLMRLRERSRGLENDDRRQERRPSWLPRLPVGGGPRARIPAARSKDKATRAG
jgi:hypothetical protein